MGPEAGTPRYEEQAAQVQAFLRNIDAKTPEEEDSIIVLFAMDTSYSRAAIMDGVGRYRTERRMIQSSAESTDAAKQSYPVSKGGTPNAKP